MRPDATGKRERARRGYTYSRTPGWPEAAAAGLKKLESLLGKILPLKLIYALQDHGLSRGLEELELSWLLEDNMPVRRVVEMVGGKLVKTYRVYEKRL